MMMIMMMIVCEKEACVLYAGVFVFVCERLIEREEFGEIARAIQGFECLLCDFLTVNPNFWFRQYVREKARGIGHPVGR